VIIFGFTAEAKLNEPEQLSPVMDHLIWRLDTPSAFDLWRESSSFPNFKYVFCDLFFITSKAEF
jgi:hypothetical protein